MAQAFAKKLKIIAISNPKVSEEDFYLVDTGELPNLI